MKTITYTSLLVVALYSPITALAYDGTKPPTPCPEADGCGDPWLPSKAKKAQFLKGVKHKQVIKEIYSEIDLESKITQQSKSI